METVDTIAFDARQLHASVVFQHLRLQRATRADLGSSARDDPILLDYGVRNHGGVHCIAA